MKVNIEKRVDFVVFVLFIFASGLMSFLFKQQASWDFLNYHLYNPFALLNKPLGVDIMPLGSYHSFHNPLIDLPYYFLFFGMENWPKMVAFFHGTYLGLVCFFVYKIAGLIFIRSNKFSKINKTFLCLAAVVIGCSGNSLISQVGSTFNEIQTSVLILAAFYILLKNIFSPIFLLNKKNLFLICCSGFLCGIASGLKLTCSYLFIAIIFTLLFAPLPTKRKAVVLSMLCLGSIIGFLVVNGWWMFLVYKQTGNPFFPYFNSLFKSSFAKTGPLWDYSLGNPYRPTDWLKAFFYPFFWINKNKGIVTEIEFRDIHWVIGWIAVLSLFAYHIKRIIFKKKFLADIHQKQVFSLLIFLISSYLLWVTLFGILRFGIVIEVLSGIVIVYFLLFIFNSKVTQLTSICFTSVAMLFFPLYSDWGHLEYISKTHKVKFPFPIHSNSLVIFSGRPLGYIGSFLPVNTKIIGLNPKFSFYWKKQIQESLQKNQGQIIVFYNQNGYPLAVINKEKNLTSLNKDSYLADGQSIFTVTTKNLNIPLLQELPSYCSRVEGNFIKDHVYMCTYTNISPILNPREHTEILFPKGIPYPNHGFSMTEENGIWTEGEESSLFFRINEISEDMTMRTSLNPFVSLQKPIQNVIVFANKVKVAEWNFILGKPVPEKIITTLPFHLFKNKKELVLTFKIIDPRSPKELQISDDPRKLGLFFKKLELYGQPYYQLNEKISFSSNIIKKIINQKGFSLSEKWGQWTINNQASLSLIPDKPIDNDIKINFNFIVHITPKIDNLKAKVWINNIYIDKWFFDIQNKNQTVNKVLFIPAHVANKGKLNIRFDIDNPVSPKELGDSTDDRKLGLGLIDITIESAKRVR